MKPFCASAVSPQSSVLGPQSKTAVGAYVLLTLSLACAAQAPVPAALDTANELCRSCRMPVSDARLAAQIAAPGEEPKFFDDIGCLRDHLRERPAARGSVAFVADHRTGAFVLAKAAVYTRCPAVSTPMSSHLLAHADSASRDADPAAEGGLPVSPREILEPAR